MKIAINCLTAVSLLVCLLTCLFCANLVSAKDKTITLKFANFHNPGSPTARPWKLWADELEKRTNGRVKVKFYWAESLASSRDMYKSIRKGVCDVGVVTQGLAKHAFPLNSVFDLPGMEFKDQKEATFVRGEILKKFPEVAAEFDDTKLLWQFVSLPAYISTKKRPVKRVEDLKGMKICGFGEGIKILDLLGTSPVAIMPTDTYMSIERGVVEGVLTARYPLVDLRLYDNLKYHTEVILFYACTQRLMNKETWNNLPPDVQDIIEDVNRWIAPIELEHSIKLDESARETLLKHDQTFIKVSPEDEKVFLDKLKPIQEEWIADVESKGAPGKAIFEEIKRLQKAWNDAP